MALLYGWDTVTANVVVDDITWERLGIAPLTVSGKEPLNLFTICFVRYDVGVL